MRRNGTGLHAGAPHPSINIFPPLSLAEPLHTSPTPAALPSKHEVVIQSSDKEDLDNDPTAHDISIIWDDERGGRADEDEDIFLENMDSFIGYEDKGMDGMGVINEVEKESRERQLREKEWRKALGNRSEMSEIDAK